MSGTWFFGANNWLTFTPGSFLGSGAYSMACLMNPSAGNNRYMCARKSGTNTIDAFMDAGSLFSTNDFSSGFPGVGTGAWYLAILTKPAGAAHYRWHVWPYAADGSGTMTHGESVGAANQGNPLQCDEIRLGGALGVGANAIISTFAYWDRALSDADCDTLKSNKLQKWKDQNPQALFPMNNWDGTTGVVDKAGTSTFVGLTGSVAVGAEPPSFDYTLGGGPVIVMANTLADNIRKLGIAQFGPGLSVMDYYNLALAGDIQKYGFGYGINKNFGAGVGAVTQNIKTHCAGTSVETMSDAAARFYAAAATLP